MNRYIIFFILSIMVFAQEHFAKLEPLETVIIKAEVSGVVIEAKSNLEGKIANGEIIKLDDKLDKLDLKHTKESLELTKKMIKINQDILPQLKKSLEKKKRALS